MHGSLAIQAGHSRPHPSPTTGFLLPPLPRRLQPSRRARGWPRVGAGRGPGLRSPRLGTRGVMRCWRTAATGAAGTSAAVRHPATGSACGRCQDALKWFCPYMKTDHLSPCLFFLLLFFFLFLYNLGYFTKWLKLWILGLQIIDAAGMQGAG